MEEKLKKLMKKNLDLFLKIKLEVVTPVFFFDAKRYHGNFWLPSFHRALVYQAIRRGPDDVAKIFTGHFKFLSRVSNDILQYIGVCRSLLLGSSQISRYSLRLNY